LAFNIHIDNCFGLGLVALQLVMPPPR